MLLHPTAPKPAWLWWDWWHLSHKHVTMAMPAGVCMEPHSLGAGGAVGTSDSTVCGRCLSHGLLLAHGHWPQCGCRGGTRLGSATLRVPGVPGAAGAACTKALHTSTSWARAATAPAPEGRWRGRGTHVALAWASSSPFPPGSWRHAWQRLAVSSTH